MSRNRSSEPATLWAITSFFNPAGYRRRLTNYRRFRAALHVPLATIELGFNGQFQLDDRDADKLMRVTDGDIMWQKERLLNLLLPQLPPECEYVAWIDSDVLFRDPHWPQRAVEQLEKAPLLQLFATLRDLGPADNGRSGTRCISSVAATVLAGRPVSALVLRPPVSGAQSHPAYAPAAHGMAWAMRREVLAQHGFYDGCVIGGGDTALLCAAYGVPDAITELWQMNAAQRDHYTRWASRFHENVKGRVAALSGEVHHLWHGELENRRYFQRHLDLASHTFDPRTDLRPGADGPWRWATDKPALHALLREYFDTRHEDGDTVRLHAVPHSHG